MAGSLVRKIATLSAAAYGINILEQAQPSGVQGVGSQVVGMVAHLPWGPENELVDIASTGEFFAVFAPPIFSARYGDYPAMRALLNKSFPAGVKVCRIAATGAAAATKAFQDGAVEPADSVVVTARCTGVLGNGFTVEWVAGSDVDKATAIVRYSSTYEVTYEDVVDGTVVTDPGDPYVVFSAAEGIAGPPAVAAPAALAGGSDGTPAATDYVGSSSEAKGIRKFYPSSVKVGALFVAEPPADLVDDINDGLLDYAMACQKGMTLLCTVDEPSSIAARTYVDDYRYDPGYVVYPYPKVFTRDTFTGNVEVEVDPGAFVAAAIVSVDPEVSPGGASGAPALAGITRVKYEFDDATYEALAKAGVACIFMSARLGAIIRDAVTTSSDPERAKIFRRRMTDFITESIGDFLEPYVEKPLDIKLSPPTLGPITQSEVGAIVAFLEGLKTANRIADYSLDPFGANTADGIKANRWILALAVQLYGSQDQIVLQAAVGQSVTITEV